ncbi:MAG: cobalamin-independent methionine synthase II family protein [Proteobacteria bacterium]|nr:cobalamin-independent methionine synthase II family protein [Pseudomonadota bacterium]
MKRSTDRILTTHTGSLPRPPDLLEMIEAREGGRPYDEKAFDERVRTAVAEVVKDQVSAGIDIVSDGEQGKPSFATYVKNRLSGFDGANPDMRVFADRRDFPEWSATTKLSSLATTPRPMCTAPLGWRDRAAFETDIRNLQSAIQGAAPEEAFIPSASLGIIAEIMANKYYPSEREYLYALADVMKEEYEAIANAGFVLQIDAPDAAMGRHSQFWDSPLEDFRAALELRVEALNHALAGIPEEQVRFHICWGNYEGPHHYDAPMSTVLPVALQANIGALLFEASNPRHAHEWTTFRDTELPDDLILIPGVIDSTTNFVEHPELVAERICRFAEIVGRERVIAGSDCGFATFAGFGAVDGEIAYAKLATMAEGARIASDRLWG